MKRAYKRAFSLIEMLVVCGIIAILAALVTGAAFIVIDSGKRTQAQVDIKGLYSAFREYEMKYGVFPPDDNAFVSGNKILVDTNGGTPDGINILVDKHLYTFDMAQINGDAFVDVWGRPYYILVADATAANPRGSLPDDIKGVKNLKGDRVAYILSFGSDESDDPLSESDPDITTWAYLKK